MMRIIFLFQRMKKKLIKRFESNNNNIKCRFSVVRKQLLNLTGKIFNFLLVNF